MFARGRKQGGAQWAEPRPPWECCHQIGRVSVPFVTSQGGCFPELLCLKVDFLTKLSEQKCEGRTFLTSDDLAGPNKGALEFA